MKYTILLLLVFLLAACFFATAQDTNGRISGVVNDVQGRPMEGATLSLLLATDSSVQKTIVANENGKFVFRNISKAVYLLEASFAGYIKHSSGPVAIDAQHSVVILPVTVLHPADNNTLRNVLVTTQKKMIEQRLDRTIVNVDAMITAAGSNALEVLQKSPGVMVDMNGNISLNGKSSVLVLIDDRPTYMSVQDITEYLKSLPAGILDKIELMSNPPAKYEASGGAIINIVLKKNRATGFNGNIAGAWNQGIYARTNASLNINYRDKKFNLFGNFSNSGSKTFNDNTDSRYFYNTDASLRAAVLGVSRAASSSHAWNARIGADYFLSPKTTIGIMATAGTRPKTDRMENTINQYDGTMKLDSISIGRTDGNYKWNNYSINLNMQHVFDSTGKKINADVDYINYRSDGNQLAPNTVYLPDNSPATVSTLFFQTPSTINIWSVKADYTQPIKRNARLDAGFKSSYVTNHKQLDWFDGNGSSFVQDYSKSDKFIYDEHITAAYITLVKEWKRWSVEGGLRAENTQSKGDQPGNILVKDSAFTIHYSSIFPTFYSSYKLDAAGNNTLTLSYSYRIHRPGYQQLNPFLFYQDKYTYSSGNPGLSPEYSSNIDLRYNYKQYIGVTFTYGTGHHLIYSGTQSVGDSIISRPNNFAERRVAGIIPNLSFAPARWWSVNLNAVILFFENKNTGDTVQLPQKTNMHEVEIFNQFHFKNGWSAEVNGFFPGRQIFGQYQGATVYNISAGVQKMILHKQASIRLKMDDIFHTMNPATQSVGIKQLAVFHTEKADTRQIGLSFSYRFGKAANARKRNHNSGGAGDEEKRAD